MWLFALFVAVPLVEIALFIQVGGLIGLWATLAVVIVTAVVGTWLVRAQGAMAISRLRASFRDLSDPTEPLADGAMILVSGAMLLTPGFFTDAVGLALLMPPVRRAVFRYLSARITVRSMAFDDDMRRRADAAQRPADPTPTGRTNPADVIDAEYHEVDPAKRPTNGSSGWTRH